MKNLLYLLLLLPILLNAQVGIGTTDPKAKLDIRASNQATPANNDGLLIPKIDEYPTTNPTALQDGMLVFVTGNGSITKGFYYWDNASTSWITVIGVKKIDDLLDAKSDNDGTNDGSSIFIGVDAGASDDSSNNQNVGIGYKSLTANTTGYNNTANGYQTLYSNTTGYRNTANGYQVLYNNTEGTYNAAVGYQALASNVIGNFNVALGHKAGFNTNGNNNVFLGYDTGAGVLDTKEGSVFIGAKAGFHESNSNRLYIENTTSSSPLIYGEFDNDLLRVNGDLEVQKTTDASITVKTPFGDKSSLKLVENDGGGDFGFELQYDGANDKLNLWSKGFSGNEAQRMTWLKNGNIGIGTTTPSALLEVNGNATISGNLKVNNEINAPDSGSADMKAYVYGEVYNAGIINPDPSSDGITSIRLSQGTYKLTFDHPISNNRYVVLTTRAIALFPGFITVENKNNFFIVRTFNPFGILDGTTFNFVVYKK